MGRKSFVGTRNQPASNGKNPVADGTVRSSDSSATTVGVRYVGNGFIPNIPACDLTAEEVEKYGGLEYLLRTRLYVQEVSDGITRVTGNTGNQVPSENPDWSGDDAGDSSPTNEDTSSAGGDAE